MPGPSHIAYLFSRYPVVSQTFCDSEMLALESRGLKLTAASLNPPPSSFRHERLRDLKAEVVYLPPVAGVKSTFAAAKKGAAGEHGSFFELLEKHDAEYGLEFKSSIRARNALSLADLLKRRGVDHIHVHFANRATHTALFLKKLGFPFSFTAHAQDFMIDLGSDELLAEMCREAEFVVAVSDFSKRLLQEKCPDAAGRIHRVYNGILPEDFPDKVTFSSDRLRIVAIGRLIEFKGFHHLIAACAKLKADGVSFECTIVGGGPWEGQLKRQVDELGLCDEIRFAGILSQNEVKRLLTESHVFCLPSIVDSKGASDILPTVILEAMAAHLPVVSTKLVGIPEMVAQGESGLLVDPGDVEPLAEALKYLHDHPEKRAEFGEAGRRKLIDIFHRDKTSEQLHGLFESVSVGASAPSPPSREVLYYLGDDYEYDEETAAALEWENLWPLAARLVGDPREGLEFFPDGVVLEGEWDNASASDTAMIDLWRNEFGSRVDGEDFYREARRGLYLATAAAKAGVKGIHARRSGEMLCVWIAHKLSELPVSAAIEEKPATSRKLLEKILPDFGLVSCSDEKLRATLDPGAIEHMPLRREATHKKKRFGPVRWKQKCEPVAELSTELRKKAKQWLRMVHEHHTAAE